MWIFGGFELAPSANTQTRAISQIWHDPTVAQVGCFETSFQWSSRGLFATLLCSICSHCPGLPGSMKIFTVYYVGFSPCKGQNPPITLTQRCSGAQRHARQNAGEHACWQSAHSAALPTRVCQTWQRRRFALSAPIYVRPACHACHSVHL